MKLDMFNPWRDLTTWSGITLQYQTSKRSGNFLTYIRDKDTKKVVTYGISRNSKEEAVAKAREYLSKIGIEGVQRAITTGQMVLPSQAAPEKDIEWRDGANHSHRAQKNMMNGKSTI